MASGEESAMVAGEESAMVATKEKRNYPRSKNPRLTVDKLSQKEQDYPTDPNKSWKEPKWQLTFDPPQLSTTFQAASKKDLRLAGWQLGKKRPAELFPLMYDQHGDPVRCVQCGMKWLWGKATGKRHNYDGFVLDSEGNKVPICVIARQKGNSAKRLKSNPAQSAAKQRQQSSNVVLVSGPASLPASGPASLPASLPAPQQPLQPLHVEPTVEQPQQQASGLDVLLQVMGESAQRPETQQLSDKSALFESVDNAINNDIPDGFVAVIPLQDNSSKDNSSKSSNGSWKSLGRFIDGIETHADTADAQAIPGMSLDDVSDL